MSRRISGFKPTGHLQLGNYLGAILPVVEAQRTEPSIVFIADLHAMTVQHDPATLRALSLEAGGLLLAAGVEADRTILYRQSALAAHAELHYLLECVTNYGEAHRMIQFKEKGGPGSRLSLLTYPVLMAADILLHDIEEVPVGQDQRQHVELTRDVATRFNARYGETFVVPDAVHPRVAARLRDLAEPTAKMGKTNASDAGVLFLLDPPDVLRRKIMRAVTDAGTEVVYDPQGRPGLANLLELLSIATGQPPQAFQGGGYGQLKKTVADAVIGLLTPIQRRYAELTADPTYVPAVLAAGAERARERADATVGRARDALGLTSAGPVLAGSPGRPGTAGSAG